MSKWFNNKDKIERERLNRYARKNLNRSPVDSFFRKLSITNWLIIVNVIIFFIVWISSVFHLISVDKITYYLAIQANNFFVYNTIWTLLTSMFVHIEGWHLVGNMISLFVIGNLLENIIGRKRFFIFYMVSGILAGLFFVILSATFGNQCLLSLPFNIGCIGPKLFFDPGIAAVGASGAIFGLIGVLAMIIPKKKVSLIYGPVILIILIYILLSYYPSTGLDNLLQIIFMLYFMFCIFIMMSRRSDRLWITIPINTNFRFIPIYAILPLVVVGLFITLPFGNTAHLGGLIVGLIFGAYLKYRYKKKTEYIRKLYAD